MQIFSATVLPADPRNGTPTRGRSETRTTVFTSGVSKLAAGASTLVTCVRLLPVVRIDMLETNRQRISEMLSLTNRRSGRCACWCAVVVLMAVCALTIRVATRYGSPETSPATGVKISRCYSAPEHGRQRLTKDGENWAPPLIVSSPLQQPASYSQLAVEAPAVANPSFASVLYYRPPPFADFHS